METARIICLPSSLLSKLSIPSDDMPGAQFRHLAWSSSIKGWWNRVGKEVLWIFWWKSRVLFILSCVIPFPGHGKYQTYSLQLKDYRFCRHSSSIRSFVRRECWIVLWILQLQNLESISLPFKRNGMNEAWEKNRPWEIKRREKEKCPQQGKLKSHRMADGWKGSKEKRIVFSWSRQY